MRRNRVKTPLHAGPDGCEGRNIPQDDRQGTPKAYMPPIPATQAVLKNTRKAREAHLKAYGQEPGFGYYNAYAATQALLDAIAKTGSTETAKISEALRQNEVNTSSWQDQVQ